MEAKRLLNLKFVVNAAIIPIVSYKKKCSAVMFLGNQFQFTDGEKLFVPFNLVKHPLA
jgi:hypothetical protein